MKGNIVAITGISGSGKTTVANMLTSAYPKDYQLLVSHTTRPPRFGEVNGRDYWFTHTLDVRDCVQYTYYGGFNYGIHTTTLEECERCDRIPVVVISTNGIGQLRNKGYNVTVVDCECEPSIALQRVVARDGWNTNNLLRRLQNDENHTSEILWLGTYRNVKVIPLTTNLNLTQNDIKNLHIKIKELLLL